MSNLFTMPADYVLSLLREQAPGIASLFGIANAEDSIALTIVLSALIWMLVCVICWVTVKSVQNLYRISEAIIRTAWYRTVQCAGNWKTWAICKYRQLIPKRRSDDQPLAAPETQFDDFDFTVLQAAADCGPGITTSAPELVSKYGLRTSQFQSSLSKLHSSKMIATVIGSTDGFDNYRLTDYGAAYMKMWEQRQAS